MTFCKRARRAREEMVFWYVPLVAAQGIPHLLGAQASALGEKMELGANGEVRRQLYRGKRYVSRLFDMARRIRTFGWVRGSRLMGPGEEGGLDRSGTFGGWREEDQGAPKEAS